ncbi:MAG: dynamin family protein [Deltaproteobacteria bacterium]|nr:dynamin family protein [Deltaproteobacteria bacterium]
MLSEPGDSLLSLVGEGTGQLLALAEHPAIAGQPEARAIAAGVAEIHARLDRPTLDVGIVGEQKAGKSTFINALLGAPVLGARARECTGTVTWIGYGAAPEYQATFEDGTREQFSRAHPDPVPALEAAHAALEEARQDLAARRDRAEAVLDEVQVQHARVLTSLVERREREARHAAERSALAALEVREVQALVDESALLRAALPWYCDTSAHTGCLTLPLRLLASSLRWMARERITEVVAAEAQVEDARGALQQLRQTHRRHDEVAAESIAVIEVSLSLQERLVLAREEALSRAEVALDAAMEAEARGARAVAVARDEHHDRFITAIRELTDMDARGAQVRALELSYPAAHLPPWLRLVDTPGVNTDSEVNRVRAEAALAEVDGCLLLSPMIQATSRSTLEFAEEVQTVVPYILLVLTRLDQAEENAEDSEEIAEVQALAVERFAKATSRAETSVLSFAVGSKPALDHEPEAEARFAAEVGRLFEVVWRERSNILGARALLAIRRSLVSLPPVIQAREKAQKARMEQLAAQRLPEPEVFVHACVKEMLPAVDPQVERVLRRASEDTIAWYDALAEEVGTRIIEASTSSSTKALLTRLEGELGERMQAGDTELQQRLAREMDARAVELVEPGLRRLQARYQIADAVHAEGEVVSLGRVALTPALGLDGEGVSLAGRVGAGGVMGGIGAAIGTVLFPGVGTVLGGAMGAAVGWAGGFLFGQIGVSERMEAAIREAGAARSRQLLGARASFADALAGGAREHLHGAVARFSEWIEGQLRAQRRERADEEASLQALRRMGARLEVLGANLTELRARAAGGSHGLAHEEAAEDLPPLSSLGAGDEESARQQRLELIVDAVAEDGVVVAEELVLLLRRAQELSLATDPTQAHQLVSAMLQARAPGLVLPELQRSER